MTYDEWVRRESERVRKALGEAVAGHRDLSGLRVFAMPTDGINWGTLEVCRDAPPGAIGPVRFPTGELIGWVPVGHIRGGIWDACRAMPVCGSPD